MFRFSAKFLKIAAVVVFSLASSQVFALEKPQSSVILEISGDLTHSNVEKGQAHFDMAMLEAFPSFSITTTTPWTDGETTFQGVLVRDLIKAVGADGAALNAKAINDYTVEIPFEDFQKYNVIIAYKMNGKPMRIRDKGPLWIIYPWDKHEELRTEVYHYRSIWQLKKLIIQ